MQMPDLSRRQVIALVVVVAGLVAMALGLWGGSGSNGPSNGPSHTNRAIKPISPLDPSDQHPTKRKDPLKGAPGAFDYGFGIVTNHKVVAKIITSGTVNAGVRYRDKKGGFKKLVSGTLSTSRTVRGQLPIVQIAFQVLTKGGRGTCEIFIDGVKIDSKSVSGLYRVGVCFG
jgi:hypothetical protein